MGIKEKLARLNSSIDNAKAYYKAFVELPRREQKELSIASAGQKLGLNTEESIQSKQEQIKNPDLIPIAKAQRDRNVLTAVGKHSLTIAKGIDWSLKQAGMESLEIGSALRPAGDDFGKTLGEATSMYLGMLYDQHLSEKNIKRHTKKYNQLTEQEKAKEIEKLEKSVEKESKNLQLIKSFMNRAEQLKGLDSIENMLEARKEAGQQKILQEDIQIEIENVQINLSIHQEAKQNMEKTSDKSDYIDSLGEGGHIKGSAETKKQEKGDLHIEEEIPVQENIQFEQETQQAKEETLSLNHGDIYYPNVGFQSTGKDRPITIIKDQATVELLTHTMTSEADTSLNHQDRYETKDLEETGFPNGSIIKAHKDNVYDADLIHHDRKPGELAKKDRSGLPLKRLEVNERERKKEKRKAKRNDHELER
ncbi:hypothetical protein RRU94_02555 [Domibacillus sp. DTU_2020_1001157_1_SI_ALB_TIR_016]|uniref:hypothetical protein n=1 Tax=Domibacillus sp. DTU_2020_1001157_1_SI_ALB_TIR_016 TaxID=3077789 RepID=UPI0028EE2483|nr:hypothetical protein [Domibacillus sp. DTU_2020_1001157_1_SI_ALB_TIR_016]WNS78846.1 hypothetical protein RRU94_02555 [Domibacillus sp. DTU_2020_1001157_1_SI_ALB_TIR_016]